MALAGLSTLFVCIKLNFIAIFAYFILNARPSVAAGSGLAEEERLWFLQNAEANLFNSNGGGQCECGLRTK